MVDADTEAEAEAVDESPPHVPGEAEEALARTAAATRTMTADGFATTRRPKVNAPANNPYASLASPPRSLGKTLPRVATLAEGAVRPAYAYAYSPGPGEYAPARDRAGAPDVGNFEAFPRQAQATFFTSEAFADNTRKPKAEPKGTRRDLGRTVPGKDGMCLQSPSWKGFSGVRIYGVAPDESFKETPGPAAHSRRLGTDYGSGAFGKTDPHYTGKERAFADVASRYTNTDHMTMSQMQKGWPGGYGPDKLSHYPGSQHYLRDLDKLPTRKGHGNFGYRGLYGGTQSSMAAFPRPVRDPVWQGMLYPRFVSTQHLDEALGRQGAGPGEYDMLRETQLGGPLVEGPLWWNAGRSLHAGIVTTRPVGHSQWEEASVVAPKQMFSYPPKLGSEQRPGPTYLPKWDRGGTTMDARGPEKFDAASRFGTDKQRWRAEEAQDNDRCKNMPGGWHQPFISEGHLRENVNTFSPGPVYHPDRNTVNDQKSTNFTTLRKPRGFSFGTGERFNYGNGMSSGGMAITGKVWSGKPAGKGHSKAKRTPPAAPA